MKKTQKRLGNKGFSLVELIVVIAIMAVLLHLLETLKSQEFLRMTRILIQ